MNRKGTIAVGEILIMIVGIFAIAWAIGSEVEIVEGTTLNAIDSFRESYLDLGAELPVVPAAAAISPTSSTPASTDGIAGDHLGGDIEDIGGAGTISQENLVKIKELHAQIDKLNAKLENEAKFSREEISKLTSEKEDLQKEIDDLKNPKDTDTSSKKGKWGEPGELFGKGTLTGALKSAAGWAIVAYSVSAMITSFLSGDAKSYGEALSPALTAGVFAGKFAYEAFMEGGVWEGKGFFGLGKETLTQNAGAWGMGIGAAVTIAVFIMMYSEEETETITFTCNPWDAPSGGNDCEKCNNNKDLPCSEYQCKSLGQSCELQNANSDTPLCSWVNRKDVVPPVITLWEDVLTSGLKFTPLTASSPDDRGTQIVSIATGKCIPAYTPLALGIQTDEPAKCKVDVLSKKNFSDMQYYFGSSLFLYNHTLIMSVPGQTVEEGEQKVPLKNDGNVQLYVRCQDPNGNVNGGNFVFKFCVDESEDTTAPQILGTNIINEMPVAFNTTEIALELYTNEPADCRWDALDKGEYDDMKNTMVCNQKASEMNAQMVYTCKANLNGIKSGTGNVNNFYFKCKDKPTASSGRNTNAQNYKLTLYGTEPLILNEVKPNGTTIKDNTDPVWVELTAKTSAGYKDGDSSCYYKLPTDREYIKFLTTGSSSHSQKLSFETGKYNVSIKCVDAGGNSAEKTSTFEVEIDKTAPEVQRIYKDSNNLRTTTNEEAECVYDTRSCSYQFNDGIAMTTVDKTNQFTEWKEDQTYYIKCRDKYGNQPDAGSCTIEAHMYEKI